MSESLLDVPPEIGHKFRVRQFNKIPVTQEQPFGKRQSADLVQVDFAQIGLCQSVITQQFGCFYEPPTGPGTVQKTPYGVQASGLKIFTEFQRLPLVPEKKIQQG